MTVRIHITGGSGSGTTTTAAHLALDLRLPHHDTDEYYWSPHAPPYSEKRTEAERLALMRAMFLPREGWVLSGSLMGWGDSLIPHFDLVVLLRLDPATRMDRLAAREQRSYGPRIAPGGDLAEPHQEFMDWARRYDDPDFGGRSLAGHRSWCAALPCAVLELNASAAPSALVARITRWLREDGQALLQRSG